ncbi:MAG: carboxypeptidase regulatory-like domain-containing protein [Vicinamibacterales bacterium]
MRNLPAAVVALVLPATLVAAVSLVHPAAPDQVTPARPAPGGTPAAQGSAVIRGTVVAMDTGAPLRRVQIRASSATADVRDARVTTTDDQGRFELRELAAGRYAIFATRAGFVGLQYGQRRPNERGTPVEVGDGQTVERVTIALPRGGVVAGRVTDEAGEPAAGVRVQVLRYIFAPGGRRLLPAGRDDFTDDQGSYRIYGLPPGDYFVSAASGPSAAMMPNARLATGDSDQGFAPTYYPGSPSPSDAERVTVAVGQEVNGISFGLTPTRLSRISGRVIGWPPTAGGGFVMVTPEDGGMAMGTITPPGQIQPEGDFEVRAVPPGRYVLRVMPRGPRDAEAMVGLATITVAGTDLGNVTIAMQPPGTMRGRIEFEGGVPAGVRSNQIRLMVVPSDQRSMQIAMTGPPQLAEDFTFTARGVMSGVFVRPNGPPGWHLKSVVIDGEDVTDTPVPFGPGAAVDGVRVLLTQVVSTVSGSVRDDRGAVVLDATVVVFPDDETRWQFGSRLIRTVRPDTEGRFEFAALPPSNAYRIVALPTIEDGQAYDPEFLAGVRDRAERLSLVEGETRAVDLRLRQ